MLNQTSQLPTGSPTKLNSPHKGPIYVTKFNFSGQYLMSGSQDRSVSLINPKNNILIKHYKNLHNYDISSLDIAKDNSKFITGGGDKLILMMDVVHGKQIRKYTGHQGRINCLTYAANQNVIISGSYDTSIKCWDNRSNSFSPIQTIKSFKDTVTQIHASETQIVASSMDGTVKFFDMRNGTSTQDKIDEPVQRMAMGSSQNAYALSTAENKIYLCEKMTGKILNQYQGHKVDQFTVDVVFSKSDSYIFSGSVDGKLYIYDIMRKTPIKALNSHKGTLSAISTNQSSGIVTGGHDGSLFYWRG